MARSAIGTIRSVLRSIARGGLRPAPDRDRDRRAEGRVPRGRRPDPRAGRPPGPVHGGTYPGDYVGEVRPVYAPHPDGHPDPGEIVWTWVPFEEDHTRGKDRPVLIVGRDGATLLGLMLSSRDHDTRPAPPDERWMDVGSGEWDAARRASEVRLDRIIRVDPEQVRREGAVLDRSRFDAVVGALAEDA